MHKEAHGSFRYTYAIIFFWLVQHVFSITAHDPRSGPLTCASIVKLDQYKHYVHDKPVITTKQQNFHALFTTSNDILPRTSLSLGLSALASLLAPAAGPAASIALLALTGALAYTSLTGRKVIPKWLWKLLGGQNYHLKWNLDEISPIIIEEISKSQNPKLPSDKKLIYEPAPYHKEVPLIALPMYLSQHATGIKSPCPPKVEGQMILDFLSFPVGPKHRIAYVGSVIIYFSFTQEVIEGRLYHGHYHVHSVHQLKKPFWDALLEQGIINGKGRFLK